MKQINCGQRLLVKARVFVILQIIMISPVFASKRLEYLAVVTNVFDGNSVSISNRPSWGGGFLNLPNTIQLKGVQAPPLNNYRGIESKKALENLVLNKNVQFVENLDGGFSHGACLFLANGSPQYAEEDCVNLIMVKTGMARWTGGSVAGGISAKTMEDAQGQAQASHKGIWNLTTVRQDTKLPMCAGSNAPGSIPQQALINAAAAPQGPAAVPEKVEVFPVANPPAAPPQQTRPVVPLAVGVGVLAALALLGAHLWRRR